MGTGQSIGTRVVRTARVLPFGDGVPVVPPLVQSVAFDHDTFADQDRVFAGERPGFVYGRYGTPTTGALEAALAELEGTATATCFTSGMAAINAFLATCPGPIVAQEDCYGATRAVLERRGSVTFVDPIDHAAVEAALAASGARLLYAEIISNPLLRVADVASLAHIAHAHSARLAIDATLATPALLRPASLGADVVIHSLTKYINGHGDVMGGAVCGSRELGAAMRERTILDGAYLPPHDAWLIIRGMRTLGLRMARHCENALAVASHLADRPKVARVHYPGLADHPQRDLACRQLGGRFGGIVSFALGADDLAAAGRFLDALELAAAATTLGDLFTEVMHPATASHRWLAPDERARLGITDGFVRISVGIEDSKDIVADLDRALSRV
ncbi:MAG: PLP-dependent transferase [Chloroflexota bacterium]|nr:PLP-dependent transferase [Chloroflexota bacterium]